MLEHAGPFYNAPECSVPSWNLPKTPISIEKIFGGRTGRVILPHLIPRRPRRVFGLEAINVSLKLPK